MKMVIRATHSTQKSIIDALPSFSLEPRTLTTIPGGRSDNELSSLSLTVKIIGETCSRQTVAATTGGAASLS
ncbi:unnamed protein product [Lactuca virosa]|uniref:Uncharacterized protein n=1 Tax=Lactuca virosa TaxID=75947 RepID=A0AAU9NN04_9ASTR|nr:unnamed protein product [Lactuca virosa]